MVTEAPIRPSNAALARVKTASAEIDPERTPEADIVTARAPKNIKELDERTNAPVTDYFEQSRLDDLNKIGHPDYYYFYAYNTPSDIANFERMGYRVVDKDHFADSDYPDARLEIPNAHVLNGQVISLIAMACLKSEKKARDRRKALIDVDDQVAASKSAQALINSGHFYVKGEHKQQMPREFWENQTI